MADADPQDPQPVAALEDRVDLALDDNPEMRAAAAGLMIAHYREEAEAGSTRALVSLGDLLKEQGDLAGARAAWQRVIESADVDWAGPAMTSLVNLLRDQDDADGLRDVYRAGLASGNPDALYALDAIGQHLAARGDIEGAHTAWQEAIEAGYEHADDLRELMDPQAGNPDDDIYPADLPAEFDPGHVIRAGVTVLERGLPALPATLSYQMAIPVAYWTADRCAVVLFLLFRRIGRGDRHPIALRVTYARGEQGWTPHGHAHGSLFDHDPIARPGDRREMDGQPLVTGGSSQARLQPPAGQPAVILTGRAGPEVTQIALIQDGREDRRPLESHFGAWVVCTERLTSFQVAGLAGDGTVLARVGWTGGSG